ncbi:MAG: autotransporter outer membrane beta-barrel domain-containing protein [Steroidobacteraceae bacterium]
MRPAIRTLSAAIAGAVLAAPPAQAADPEFQDFFFDVCLSPTGALAIRCAETPAAGGDLSGDSESSLNPSQNLSHNQPAISVAQTRSKEARERSEKLRDDDGEASEGAAVAAGPFSLLVNLHGTWFDREADPTTDSERGFDGGSEAAEIGFDYRLSDRTVLGAIVGFERMDYDFDPEAAGVNFIPASRAGEADSDNTYLTLFASWSVGQRGYIELAGGYERNDGSYRRNSVFQESTRTIAQTNVIVEGDADGDVQWTSLNGGFDIDRGAFNFGPYAGLTKTRATVDGYTERDLNGSGLNMIFAETKRDSLLGHAGLRASYVASTGIGIVIPQLRVEFHHEFEEDAQDAIAQFALDSSGTEYQLLGDEPDTDSINAGFSIAFVLPNGWMPFFDWSVLLEDDVLDRQRATLGLRVEF